MFKWQVYVGLFLASMALLMYEILLTRIFSVTTSYDFAFMAVSIAMFGMTLGALFVHLFPAYFRYERSFHQLALYSLLFGLSTLASFLVYLRIPPFSGSHLSQLFHGALVYLIISNPFIFAGICVCLALTRFPGQISKLYAANLAGSGMGCLFLLYTLAITDAPTAMIVTASLACLGSLFFATQLTTKTLTNISLTCAALLAVAAATNTIFVRRQSPMLRLTWVKGQRERPPLYEKWNSFSRITITGNPNEVQKPIGWGFSPACPCDKPIAQLAMSIDTAAETVLTAFDGNLNNLEYLKYDVSNLVHYIRPNSRILIIGTGGGRDVLSALVFGQKSILGVEINRDIIASVNQVFGNFTGYLDEKPNVTFVNDEARSYIARAASRFDIIQASLADTWASTVAGAFGLTENSLYTIEAWKQFISHLEPHGILTFSRWYLQEGPFEMYRLTRLAAAALMELGVENPRQHIVIVKNPESSRATDRPAIGTLLVSRDPFSSQDLDKVETIAKDVGFDLVLDPRFSLDDIFGSLAERKDIHALIARLPLNIAPPEDDSPFFFNMSRFEDLFTQKIQLKERSSFYLRPSYILGSALIVTFALTLLCIIGPLVLIGDRSALAGTWMFFSFFCAIGLAFMLIEISLVQRLTIFLGHPIYTLSVILFTLLLSSGLGSYWTKGLDFPALKFRGTICLLLLVLTLSVFGRLIPRATGLLEEAAISIRLAATMVILFPLGVLMGIPFPLGIKLVSNESKTLSPWLFGLNGAASVFGSVLAAAIALNLSISASFQTGVLCYIFAVVAFVFGIRRTTASKN